MKRTLKDQVLQQREQLNHVLQAVGGSLFGTYLGLNELSNKKAKSLHLLHADFASKVEVLSHRAFMALVTGLAPVQNFTDENEVFLYKNLLTKEPLGGIAHVADGTRAKSLPLSQKQLQFMRFHRNETLLKLFNNKSLVDNLNKLHLYKNPFVHVLTSARIWHTGLDVFLAQPEKKFFSKGRPPLPDLDIFRKGSRHLKDQIRVFTEVLMAHKETEVLYAYPFQLSDLAFYLEQAHGRSMRLVDVLPSLSLIMLDALDYHIHASAMLPFLQGYGASVHTHLYRADGIFGRGVDADEPTVIAPALDAGVFYEFIPLSDFYALKGEVKANHKRLSIEQVEVGQDYGVVINSIAGVIGFNTKLIVQVTQKEPLEFKIVGQLSALDGLGQNLTAAHTQKMIINLNKTIQKSYQLHVNHFMVGEHHNREALVWVLELNIPPQKVSLQILRGIANSLHAALAKTNGAYRRAFEKENIFAPIFAFVAPGTFLNAGFSGFHCLDFSSDGQLVRMLMAGKNGQDAQNVVKLRAARINRNTSPF